MSKELAFQPDLMSELNYLKGRVTQLERYNRNFMPVALPMTWVGGNPRTAGFYSTSETSYVNMFRCDYFATAPSLNYDIQYSWLAGPVGFNAPTTPPTSIDWRIRAYKSDDQVYVTLASANETTSQAQRSGYVDLFDALGEDVYNQFIRVDIDLRQTGGTADTTTLPQNPSDVVGIRLVVPILLRTKSS